MKKILVTIPVREKDRKFLEEKGKEFQFCYRTKEEITVSDVVDAEIILGNIPVELVPKAKKLKFLQLDSAGSTEYTASGVLMPDTKLANATGAYGLAISEYMLAGVLMLRKKLHLYQKNMEQHLWKDEGEVLSIRDSVTLVVGLGDIGSQFAEKMHALGSEVIGVRKHKAARPDYIKEVCQQEDLDRLLPKADIVACCMPGTGETAGMFDLERMKKMKADPHYNALQVKYAYAVTCHKAQGGQWKRVFLDQGYMTENMLTPDYFRWLYTAFTRATEILYLVNWPKEQTE